MFAICNAGSIWSQELGTKSGFPMWVVGPKDLSHCCSQNLYQQEAGISRHQQWGGGSNLATPNGVPSGTLTTRLHHLLFLNPCSTCIYTHTFLFLKMKNVFFFASINFVNCFQKCFIPVWNPSLCQPVCCLSDRGALVIRSDFIRNELKILGDKKSTPCIQGIEHMSEK